MNVIYSSSFSWSKTSFFKFFAPRSTRAVYYIIAIEFLYTYEFSRFFGNGGCVGLRSTA
jgi:hypothetical protein